MHPVRVRSTASMTVGLALAFAAISRTSGAGWANVIVALLAGTLAVGALGPALALTRARFKLDTPTDATARTPTDITITATKDLVAEIPELGSGRFATRNGKLVTYPPRRGVIRNVTVDLRSAAPIGMFEWKRTVRISLPAPLEVGPLPIPMPLPQRDQAAASHGVELTRGIRDYQPGDPLKRVHWPASARQGDLVVRELETLVERYLVIKVELTGTEATDDGITGRAAGLASAALAGGYIVVLHTDEISGPVEGAALSKVDVSRRLARAVTRGGQV